MTVPSRLSIGVPSSPSQSVSDGYSIISDSDLLDPQYEKATANTSSRPEHQLDLPEKADHTTGIIRILEPEISKAKGEHGTVQKAFKIQEATNVEDNALQGQSTALCEDGADDISDVYALTAKYRGFHVNITSAECPFEGQGKAVKLTDEGSLEKSHETKILKTDKEKPDAVSASRGDATLSSKSKNENPNPITQLLEQNKNFLSTMLASREGEIRSLQEVNTFLQEKGAMLVKTVEGRDEDITKLKGEVRDLSDELKHLKQDEGDLHATISARNREVKVLQKQLIDAKLHSSELQQDIDSRDEQILDLQGRAAASKAGEDNLRDLVQNLSKDIQKVVDLVEDLQIALAGQDDDAEVYNEKLHNARCRGRRLKKQRDSARAANKHDD